MSSQRSLPRALRVLKFFAATRAVEVLALQASPLLGAVLGGYRWHPALGVAGLAPFAALMGGSCALTAHVFVFNDWAGAEQDRRDPLRAASVFACHGIERRDVAWLALAALLLAMLAFALLGATALPLGGAIAALGVVYSAAPFGGKSTPVAASINHLLGGTLHFLLGYTLAHPLDAAGWCIGLFFGLVFSAGHLNQEVRDYAGDLRNGIRTNAVAFGARTAFLASEFTFSAAYAMLTLLAAVGLVPRLLLASPLAWFVQLVWARQALRRGMSFDTAVWMQRRYRALFALVALALLAGAFWNQGKVATP